MNTLKIKALPALCIALTILSVVLSCVLVFKTREVSGQKAIIEELNARAQVSLAEKRELRVLSALFKEASVGLHETEPETIKKASKAVAYIVQLREPAELEFAECWDREINSHSWGSDGPYGILEACIDKIKSKDTAVLMHEMESAVEVARAKCGINGKDRYEMAQMCFAESGFRLISGARNLLFSAITSPEAIYGKSVSLD